jgi:hypothetical protein
MYRKYIFSGLWLINNIPFPYQWLFQPLFIADTTENIKRNDWNN